MAQFGFLVNPRECVACKACEIACKARNGLESPGPRLRIVQSVEQGKFPETKIVNQSFGCMHCEHPACVEVCPAGAITKREEDGAVVADRSKCIGCQACHDACPWGVPQYRDEDGTMVKCDGCLDRHMMGLEPACAQTCFYTGLYAGTLEELYDKAAELGIEVEPLAGETGPSVLVAKLD